MPAGPPHNKCLRFLSACDYEGNSLMRREFWASAGQLIPEALGLTLDACARGGLVLWGGAGGGG